MQSHPMPKLAAVLVALPILLLFPGLPLLLMMRGLAWDLANLWQEHRTLCLIGVPLAVIALQAIAAAFMLSRRSGNAGVRPLGPRSLAAHGAVGAIWMLGNVTLGVVDNRVHDYLSGAQPTVREFYRNHDGAALAGRTVRMVLLREREASRGEADRAALAAMAKIMPEAWVQLVDAQAAAAGAADSSESATTARGDTAGADANASSSLIGGENSVDEPLLSVFLFDRGQPAMDPARWGAVLDRLCAARGVEPLSGAVRERAAQRLTDTFGLSLREALKHAWKTGDKAWPALVIDMQTLALERIRSAIDEQSVEWRTEFAALHGSMAGLKRELATLSEQQRDNHRQVIDRLMRLEEKIDAMARTLDRIEQIAGETRQEAAAARHEAAATRAEVALLREDFARVASALSAVSSGEGAPTPQITPDMAEPIRRLLAFGDPIDKALALIASVKRPYTDATWTEADAFLAQANLWRASGVDWTDDSAYRYQIVQGERRRFDDDPDGAAPFYKAALVLRPGDPMATIRLALVLKDSRAVDHGDRLRQALALLDGLLERPDELDESTLAVVCNNRSGILGNLGRHVEALEAIDRAIAISLMHFAPDHPSLATMHSNRANILSDLGRHAEALEAIDRAIAISLMHFAPDHPTLATSHSNRANILGNLGRHAEALEAIDYAIEINRQHFPSDHPDIATRHSNRSLILRNLGRLAEALEAIDRAIEIDLLHFPPDHPTLATSHSNRSNILGDLGRHAEALEAIDRAIEIFLTHFPPDHPTLATRHSNRANILGDLGRHAEALEAIDRAIEIDLLHFPPDHPTLATMHSNRANILKVLGRYAEALEAVDRAIEIFLTHFPPDHPSLATMHSNRANILGDLGRHDEALTAIDRAIELQLQHFPPDHPSLATMHSNRAFILHTSKRMDEAVEAMQRAMVIVDAFEHTRGFSLRGREIMVYWLSQNGQPERAIEAMAELLARAEDWLGPDDEQTIRHRTKLEELRAEQAASPGASDPEQP
ncbi:MAG: tetratricopeptide repeat protein [Phycisphaeraceae bacterium]|nr:tetratricopeptide repeat protein [Phycisphaeraceae bacterium]